MVEAQPGSPATSSRYIHAIQTAYGSYVEAGGDGDDVWKVRGQQLGYDAGFLQRCGLPVCPLPSSRDEGNDETETTIEESAQQTPPPPPTTTTLPALFAAFCGSGCPLRIENDRHLPKAGDTVVDLGCGAGHDAILAGGLVGPTGRVLGVDFTRAMIDRSVRNAERWCRGDIPGAGNFARPLFVEGGIDDPERLFSSVEKQPSSSSSASAAAHGRNDSDNDSGPPLERGCADVVLSNGVVNLCADKAAAFRTAFELLKPRGRFLLSDLCLVRETPGAAMPPLLLSSAIGDSEVTR